MRIDTHHHFITPALSSSDTASFARMAPGFAHVLRWTPERSIEQMDEYGVDVAVLCVAAAGIKSGPRAETASVVRKNNEYAAGLVREHAGRFALFADLPLPYVEESLAELTYAFDTLGAAGIRLQSCYGDVRPGDAEFAPIFELLNARKAVVFVHPSEPSYGNVVTGIPGALMEYPFDTTRAIANLLFSGTFTRSRDIRFIFAHGGGTLPMLAHRLAEFVAVRPALQAQLPDGPLDELKHLYFDVVSVANPVAFASTLALAGVDKLLLGSDVPYFSIGDTLEGLAVTGLSDVDLVAIEGGNALRLMPQLGHMRC